MDDLLDGKIEAVGGDMTPGALKIVDHFKGLEEAAKDYTQANPEWCAELYDVQAQIKKLQDREAKLKEVVKKWKERGTFIHGSYSLDIKERAGNRTLDKEALLARIEAELGVDEAKVYADACMKQGKPTVVITVRKLGQTSGDPVGGGSVGEGL